MVNVWWEGLRIVPIEKQTYKCSCPRCKVPFEVPEDLPEREEDFYGIDVFIVSCRVWSAVEVFDRRDTNGAESSKIRIKMEKVKYSIPIL